MVQQTSITELIGNQVLINSSSFEIVVSNFNLPCLARVKQINLIFIESQTRLE